MTTATEDRTATAPTEQDIRAALEARAEDEIGTYADRKAGLAYNVHSMAVGVSWPLSESGRQSLEGDGLWEGMPEGAEGTLWGDLRPSEAVRLVELVAAACDRARDRCVPIILEELTAAGLAFAAEHPDAPRPSTKEPVRAGA